LSRFRRKKKSVPDRSGRVCPDLDTLVSGREGFTIVRERAK
jgi:hypothetical protein